jgi:hypothetical protein
MLPHEKTKHSFELEHMRDLRLITKFLCILFMASVQYPVKEMEKVVGFVYCPKSLVQTLQYIIRD